MLLAQPAIEALWLNGPGPGDQQQIRQNLRPALKGLEFDTPDLNG